MKERRKEMKKRQKKKEKNNILMSWRKIKKKLLSNIFI
jgi:hypothetical protein